MIASCSSLVISVSIPAPQIIMDRMEIRINVKKKDISMGRP